MPRLCQPCDSTMLLYLHPRYNYATTSVLAWRGTDENFWGRNLDSMRDGPTFPSWTFEAGSEPTVPCVVGQCQGGEPHHYSENKDISRDFQARSCFQVGDHVELLQLCSCACATRITWPWTLEPSVGRNLIYVNALIYLTIEMS